MKTIALIGAGGHCKVLIDLINEIDEYEIIGIYDDYKQGTVSNIPIIGSICQINWSIAVHFIIAIGNDQIRRTIAQEHKDLNWATLIHPKSIVSKTACIGQGTVVCAGAIVQTDVIIGQHGIINTNCNIDHETLIGDFCSICPSATICGRVTIGDQTMVGANATIIQNIHIGTKCIVGAGSVIIRNIGDGRTVVGNPGRIK